MCSVVTHSTWCASLRCVVDKFDKHLSYLHDVFPFFEHLKPEAIFASSEQPPLPPGLLFYTDNEILVHGEWQRLTAADSIDRLHWRSQATKDRPSMEDFWYSYKDKYPNLNAIVRRLLGLRTGIVDVERLFQDFAGNRSSTTPSHEQQYIRRASADPMQCHTCRHMEQGQWRHRCR